MVEKEKDIKQAMEFLHACDLLKIEDVLPFFPDFVTIDDFKVMNVLCVCVFENIGSSTGRVIGLNFVF